MYVDDKTIVAVLVSFLDVEKKVDTKNLKVCVCSI